MKDMGTVFVGEAATDWRARFEGCCNLSSDYCGQGMRFEFPPVFRATNWKVLPLPAAVDNDALIFDLKSEEAGPQDVALARFFGASEAYLRGHWPPVSPFAEFWPMLRGSGVEEVALTGWGTPVHAVWVGPPCDEAVSDATMHHFKQLGVTAVECALTDASGRWAIYSSPLEDLSVLGAEPAFFDAFVERAGGLAWLQAIHAMKNRGEDRDSFRALYAQIGWNWPFDDQGRPIAPSGSSR